MLDYTLKDGRLDITLKRDPALREPKKLILAKNQVLRVIIHRQDK